MVRRRDRSGTSASIAAAVLITLQSFPPLSAAAAAHASTAHNAAASSTSPPPPPPHAHAGGGEGVGDPDNGNVFARSAHPSATDVTAAAAATLPATLPNDGVLISDRILSGDKRTAAARRRRLERNGGGIGRARRNGNDGIVSENDCGDGPLLPGLDAWRAEATKHQRRPPPPPPPPWTEHFRETPAPDGVGGEWRDDRAGKMTVDLGTQRAGKAVACRASMSPRPILAASSAPATTDRTAAGHRHPFRGSTAVDGGGRRGRICFDRPAMTTSVDGQGEWYDEPSVTLSIDPAGVSRLVPALLRGGSSLVGAVMGTLRLLGPLVLSRRVLNTIGDIIVDWYTGRFFRTTYSRLERVYLTYYEFPSVFRAAFRTSAQVSILFLLSATLGWLMNVSGMPCRSEGKGLFFVCGLLWIGAVVGAGHACSAAVAVWGGPLRIQAAVNPKKKNRNMLLRPWIMLQWLQDLEFSSHDVQAGDLFETTPLIFPSTWAPLMWLQICAVARAFATDPQDYRWCAGVDKVPTLMKQFLIQLAIGDEWRRVFLGEKRVGLGVCVAVCYFIALLWSVVTGVMMDRLAALMMVPCVLSVIVSGYMNILILWYRTPETRRRATLNALSDSRQAALKAIKIQPSQ